MTCFEVAKGERSDKDLDTGKLESSHAAQRIHISYTYEVGVETQITNMIFSPY